jgi:hypothetical protein
MIFDRSSNNLPQISDISKALSRLLRAAFLISQDLLVVADLRTSKNLDRFNCIDFLVIMAHFLGKKQKMDV